MDLPERFWARHSNPASGWSRVPTGPLVVLAVYRRDRRLLAAVVAYVLVNPVLFPAPERTDDWMSRGVLGERQWLADDRPLFARRGPALANLLNLGAFGYALYAAARRRPLGAALGTLASVALKLYFVGAMVDYYDEHGDDASGDGAS